MTPPVAHVLLLPEDVQGQSPSGQPMYGSVISVDGHTALVGLRSPPNVTVQVATTTLPARRVPAEEFDDGAPGLWLRQAVVGKADGKYAYGQVVAYEEGMATIRTAQGTIESLISDLMPVQPVVCFLLSRLDASIESLSETMLARNHDSIMNRLLGRNGQRPTRAIPRLLSDIAPARQRPTAEDTLRWISANTGRTVTVSVRHAIDYVYYVEGGRRVPSSQQPNIGERFDQDPNHAEAPSVAADHPEDDETDDLDALLHRIATQADARDPQHPRDQRTGNRPRQLAEGDQPTPGPTPASTADQHGKVLAAIADTPDLVRFYLSMCQSIGNKRPAAFSPEPSAQRRRISSPSDLFDVSEAPVRPSKHAFNPSTTQQAINRLLVAPEHEGKTPSELIETMLSSRSTKFKPHPAIMTRVYDIEFGRRGLTLMHFVRFDFTARRAWYADGSVNLNNFSASVALPKAPRPKSLDDISNALTVLHLFAEEFFEPETCRLISCAREFVEELRSFCQWNSQDVETLTFWFDSVLEQYRTASEIDARKGSATRLEIKSKMSLQDPDLQSVLYVIQSERLALLMAAPNQRSVSDKQTSKDWHRRSESTKPARKTPQEVIDALPRRGRQTVCMKYLSVNGCPSKSDERCTFPNHAHFIPDELDPVVRDHITSKLGGLRSELRQ